MPPGNPPSSSQSGSTQARLIAGIDEAGRGPLAGPVTAAAVILDPRQPIPGLADSKTLAESRRKALYEAIVAGSLAWAVVSLEPAEIDRLNILEATLKAMALAVDELSCRPDLALVDGNRPPKLVCPVRCVVGGDRLEPAISAASIVAKVTRDRVMVDLHERYPDYGFQANKGYPTPQHLAALERFGVTPVHRRSFRPVRQLDLGL